MKRIIALIRPVMRDDVIFALHQVENFPGAALSDMQGIRRGLHQQAREHRETPGGSFVSLVRFEIVCSDDLAPLLVETIRANAFTGKPGDGKIFVSDVQAALRISNGQLDEDAL
ncbi:MAG: P-II family nitrogen regulator [Thermodesulfobacteriota bacterium]